MRARSSFDEGHMIQAVESLNAYVQAHPGSNRLDEALLLLGLARQRTDENQVAVEDFNRLIRDFPQSPYREQAEFERARCSLNEALSPPRDAEATETALALLRAYVLRYPEGEYAEAASKGIEDCLERLAVKAFLNAETYLRLKRDRAAMIYLEKALGIKKEFSRAGAALMELARVRERLGEVAEAREAWEDLLEYATPERIERDRRLGQWRREAESALGRLSSTGEQGQDP